MAGQCWSSSAWSFCFTVQGDPHEVGERDDRGVRLSDGEATGLVRDLLLDELQFVACICYLGEDDPAGGCACVLDGNLADLTQAISDFQGVLE